jgi:hypothetical protein
MPNRHKPFTIQMHLFLVQSLELQPHIHGPNSALAAICDSCSLGICSGFRLIEWAQPNAHSELDKPQLNRHGDAMAFCPRNVRFLTPVKKVRTPTKNVITMDVKDPKVGRDVVTCCTQKNGQDGKEQQHAQNSAISAPCHVTCLMPVVQRFDRLAGNRSIIPLCVHRKKDGRIRHVTDSIVVHWVHMVAAHHVYKLDPVKDRTHLRKWPAHSLRVGAAIILHGMVGFPDVQIQFLLIRW